MRRLAGAERRDIRFASGHQTRRAPRVPLWQSIPYERGVPCYCRALRTRLGWVAAEVELHDTPMSSPGEASVAIQGRLGRTSCAGHVVLRVVGKAVPAPDEGATWATPIQVLPTGLL